MHPAPLTLPEFAASLAAIGGFETRPLIAVAVSGGPDSMALMLLADRWARMRGGRAWGLTVDHGLRRESADEARTVGVMARRPCGFRTISCAGCGPKPASGIQEAAREARYRLLTAWCRDRCCLHLLTAHHLEDQIETHLIRRRAGSGVDGLAGMSAVRELSGCRLVRPLLCRSLGRAWRAARGRRTAVPARSEQPEPGLRARPPPVDVYPAISLSPTGREAMRATAPTQRRLILQTCGPAPARGSRASRRSTR